MTNEGSAFGIYVPLRFAARKQLHIWYFYLIVIYRSNCSEIDDVNFYWNLVDLHTCTVFLINDCEYRKKLDHIFFIYNM